MPRCSSRTFHLAWISLALVGPACADITATWNGTSGNWTDAARWSTAPIFPNNNAPDFYDAVINAGVIALNQNIAINQLALGGGTLGGGSTLSLAEGFAWSGGATVALTGAGKFVLGVGSASAVSGSAVFQSGTIVGGGAATIGVPSGAAFLALNQAAFFADIASPAYTFDNAGTFTARATSGAGFTSMDAVFNNTGVVNVELAGGTSHTLSLAGGGVHSGAFHLQAGTTVEFGGTTTLQDGASFDGNGIGVVAGNVLVTGGISGGNLTVAVGELNLGASVFDLSGTARQTGGTLRIGGGTLSVAAGLGTLIMDDGTLTGVGTLDANLSAQGIIAPGAALGTLGVSGAAAFGTDAQLAIEIGGASGGSFDLLTTASASLGGTLDLRLFNGFMPGFGDSFTILTASSGVSGFFANAPLDGSRLDTTDGLGSFAIDYTATSVVLTQFIPEPSSVLLAAVAGSLLVARRRRATSASR
ncbi:MAG: hypothetical protein ABMA13_21375 [Chthoniobacteraceae bacterium]